MSEEEEEFVDAMLTWGSYYIQRYSRMPYIGNYFEEAHSGEPASKESMRLIGFAKAVAWRYADLDIKHTISNDLPGSNTLHELTELLGPPKWYMALDSAFRDDIWRRLQSGEFQKEAGMPMDKTLEKPTTAQCPITAAVYK